MQWCSSIIWYIVLPLATFSSISSLRIDWNGLIIAILHFCEGFINLNDYIKWLVMKLRNNWVIRAGLASALSYCDDRHWLEGGSWFLFLFFSWIMAFLLVYIFLSHDIFLPQKPLPLCSQRCLYKCRRFICLQQGRTEIMAFVKNKTHKLSYTTTAVCKMLFSSFYI